MPDLGVDGHIEIVASGHATNFVAPFQMKARSDLELKKDGAFPLRLESQTFNYLLNAQSSIALLYNADNDRIYWVSALDEARRLERDGVDYRNQDGVTLNFSRHLTAATASELYDEIMLSGRTARRLRGAVASLDPGAMAFVDAAGNSSTSANIEEEFFQRAQTLALEGKLDEVERLFGLMRPALQQSPRAKLFLSYAHYCNGRPVATRAYAADASRRLSDLSPAERDLLTFLKTSADYFLGRVTRDELSQVEDDISRRAADPMRIPLQVGSLRRELTACADGESLPELASRARALASRARSQLGAAHPATLSARFFELELEGQFVARAHHQFLLGMMHGDDHDGLLLRRGMSRIDAARATGEHVNQWMHGVTAAIASSARWPLLCLQGWHLVLLMRYSILKNHAFMDVVEGRDPRLNAAGGVHAHQLSEEIDYHVTRARTLRIDDEEIRFRLLLVDALDLAGDDCRRRTEAEALIALCRDVGSDHYERAARERAGESILAATFADIARRATAADSDRHVALADSQQRDEIADGLRDMMGLPPDRLPALRDYVECTGALQELQHEWCRHLDMEDDPSHTRSSLTMYRQPPERGCVCDATGSVSALASRDWRAVLDAFQRAYCAGCSQRSPGKDAPTR